ncbi:hypothetical protein BB560_005786, partial [Smittium megazygosporum]
MKFSLSSYSAIILAALGCVSGQSNTPQCSNLRVRNSVDRLSSSDIETLGSTYNMLYQLGWNDWFAFIHGHFFTPIHYTPEFLPWHRRFTLDLEDTARFYNPNFVLPYFDAAAVCNDPASSVMFSGALYGGNGGSDGCVHDGFQAGWNLILQGNHCLQRSFSGGNYIQPWECPESISNIIQTSNSYNKIRSYIENGIHASVHNGIGGDMVTAYSPNDMIFYLHHANIDRLWLKWQNLNPQIKYDYTEYGVNGDPNSFDIPLDNTVSLTLYSDRVVDTMDVGYGKFCYAYDDTYPAPRGSGPMKRSDSAIFKRDDLIQDSSKVQLVASTPQMSLTSALDPSVLQSLFPLTARNAVSNADVALPQAVSANAVKFAAAVKAVGNSTDAQLVSSVADAIDVNNVEGSINAAAAADASSKSGVRAGLLDLEDSSAPTANGETAIEGNAAAVDNSSAGPEGVDAPVTSAAPVASGAESASEGSDESSAPVSSASVSVSSDNTNSTDTSGSVVAASAVPDKFKYPIPARLPESFLRMMNMDLGVYENYYQSRVQLANVLNSAGY